MQFSLAFQCFFMFDLFLIWVRKFRREGACLTKNILTLFATFLNCIKKHWCCVTVLSLVIFLALFTLLPVPDYSCFTLKSNVPYVCESVKYLESDFSRLSVRLKLVFDIDLNMKLLWSQDPLSKWYHNKSCSNPSRWNYFDF